MSFLKNFFSQTKKPQGFLGRMMVSSMNSGHAPMAAWGTARLPLLAPKHIVDLGCGGGQNAANLLQKYPASHVTAVDYSEVSVQKAEQKNAAEISGGRCQVLQGDVSALSLDSGSFDLATAFETIYFWPGPLHSFREVFRILKPQGYFLIVNECDGTNPKDQKWVDMIDGMTIYSKSQIMDYLKAAGFSSVEVTHDQKKHWICFLAQKP